MRMFKSALALVAVVTTLASAPVLTAAQPTTPPQTEFVPIDELPPQDQLPAAPLLITAYVIVIGVFFIYLISLARRMSALQREMRELESNMGRGRRE